MSNIEKVYYSPLTDTIWIVGRVEILPFKFDFCGSNGYDICWFLEEHLEKMIYMGEL